MAPKRKAAAPPDAPPEGKKKNGGAGRGQGKKPKNAPGVDDPALPPKVQLSMADLLGARFAKKPTEAPAVDADAAPAATDDEDYIEWVYERHDGGEEDSEIPQKQRPRGRVCYDLEKDSLAIVLAKGPEIYYVDKNDQEVEVDATHENAERRERHGGMLNLQFQKDGLMEPPVWITWRHVQAVEAAGAAGGAGGADAGPMADAPAAARSPAAAQAMPKPAGAAARPVPARTAAPACAAAAIPAAAAPAAPLGQEADGEEAEGGAQQGGAIKAAAKAAKKPRPKAPEGAKGHPWKPEWLTDYPWLCTEPSKTRNEWEDTPKEAPDYIYCCCCVAFPTLGHKDVVQKKKKEAMRRYRHIYTCTCTCTCIAHMHTCTHA